MEIYGLQKLTLLDYPKNTACTVFLGGCNFRCPFCHNMELCEKAVAPIMTDSDFFEFLKKRKGLLDGVAITGGEPCLEKELLPFIQKIRDMGFKVKLDSNGTYPTILKSLLDNNLLDYVAMDIKNSEEKYPITCGISFINLDAIKESIRLLMTSGVEYEFRTTVVNEFHDEKSFDGISKLIAGAEHYYLQQFVDRDTVCVRGLHAPDMEDMMRYAEICSKTIKDVEIRGM